tara:strand:+ start:2699 stop:3565 length:867 start_codon:yes stop_codon:yes gene_type:complete
MKYTLTWQDFMRQPENMLLKESKGIFACKQKFIQEQNKLMWMDPMIINEGNQDAGTTNAANAADGSSTQFITGFTAEAVKFTFDAGVNLSSAGLTGASGSRMHGSYFDIEGIKLPSSDVDFTSGHTNSKKVFRIYFTSGSTLPTIHDPANSTHGIHAVVTASIHNAATSNQANDSGAGFSNSGSLTGSFNVAVRDAINNQSATAVLAGITNTIAPNSYFTASVTTTTTNFDTLVITNVNKGAVKDLYQNGEWSGSFSTTTYGTDTYHQEQGGQIFDGGTAPYTSMPRK